MTLLLEAAPAAIFLPERLQKPVAPEYIGGDILKNFDEFLLSQTISEEYTALNAIILQFGKPIIHGVEYTRFYKSGPHDKSAPIFEMLGFPHTLRNETLTSLLIKRDETIRWQFIFKPEDNVVSVLDSATARSSTHNMSEAVSEPYFDYLRTIIEDTLWPKFVRTSNGMMVKS